MSTLKLFRRRRNRVRTQIKVNNRSSRYRLTVFRSHSHIYAQLVDDSKGVTIAQASSLKLKDVEKKGAYGGNISAAKEVGYEIADKAIKLNVSNIVFDKGGYAYHGRIKALADAVREKKKIVF